MFSRAAYYLLQATLQYWVLIMLPPAMQSAFEHLCHVKRAYSVLP